MKRTHKRKALGDAGAVVAASVSIAAAAKALGVERSTVHRWVKSGAVPPPGGGVLPAAPAVASADTKSPEAWAVWVRERCALDATGDQLLQLAVEALRMARVEERVSDKIAAMARFQQLVKQLNLQAAAVANVAPPAPKPRQVRTGTDPRAFLMAVK